MDGVGTWTWRVSNSSITTRTVARARGIYRLTKSHSALQQPTRCRINAAYANTDMNISQDRRQKGLWDGGYMEGGTTGIAEQYHQRKVHFGGTPYNQHIITHTQNMVNPHSFQNFYSSVIIDLQWTYLFRRE